MKFSYLSFDAPIADYERQAGDLLKRYRGRDPEAFEVFRRKHPRFLDSNIKWLSLNSSDDEISAAGLDLAEAQLAVARMYDFLDWQSLVEWVTAVSDKRSPVFRFEAGAEAVIAGDAAELKSLLRGDPELARARSSRVCCFDPPRHRATLLHYVAANGVEGYRQKTPPNAVEIARILLDAGAEADALADMYGGQCTTMSMLVSSCHPANAGVQSDLVNTLVDYGAAVEPLGAGNWTSPLMTALIFGYLPAAEALLRRGAKVDTLAAAAGLGRIDDMRRLFPASDAIERHAALALAAQRGQLEAVRILLDAGEDPNRYNPEGYHGHATPLHQAVWGAHMGVVQLLIERGADLSIKDKIFKGTPLGWAEYGKKTEVADYLRANGAID